MRTFNDVMGITPIRKVVPKFDAYVGHLEKSFRSIIDDDGVVGEQKLAMMSESASEFAEFAKRDCKSSNQEIQAAVEKVADKTIGPGYGVNVGKRVIDRQDDHQPPDFATLEADLNSVADSQLSDHEFAIKNVVRQFQGQYPDLTDAEAAHGKRIMEAAIARAKGNERERATILTEKDDTRMSNFSTLTKKLHDRETVTQADCMACFQERADDIFKAATPGTITKAQAFEKAYTAPDLRPLRKLLEELPNVTPMVKKASPVTVSKSYQSLQEKAEEIRKAEPRLSQAQAFTKAYCDPANRALVEQHRRESMNGNSAA